MKSAEPVVCVDDELVDPVEIGSIVLPGRDQLIDGGVDDVGKVVTMAISDVATLSDPLPQALHGVMSHYAATPIDGRRRTTGAAHYFTRRC